MEHPIKRLLLLGSVLFSHGLRFKSIFTIRHEKGRLTHLQCWSRSDETTAVENLIMFLSYVVME